MKNMQHKVKKHVLIKSVPRTIGSSRALCTSLRTLALKASAATLAKSSETPSPVLAEMAHSSALMRRDISSAFFSTISYTWLDCDVSHVLVAYLYVSCI